MLEAMVKIEQTDEFVEPPETCTSSSNDTYPAAFLCISEQSALPVNFKYPIPDEDTIELLEAAVHGDKLARRKYINFLRKIKTKSANIATVFSKIFCDESMYNYNMKGSSCQGRKKPMKNYAIFWDCMLEAWRDHGVEPTSLQNDLARVVGLINKRKRHRKYRMAERVAL